MKIQTTTLHTNDKPRQKNPISRLNKLITKVANKSFDKKITKEVHKLAKFSLFAKLVKTSHGNFAIPKSKATNNQVMVAKREKQIEKIVNLITTPEQLARAGNIINDPRNASLNITSRTGKFEELYRSFGEMLQQDMKNNILMLKDRMYAS